MCILKLSKIIDGLFRSRRTYQNPVYSFIVQYRWLLWGNLELTIGDWVVKL
jgi:hypothetical protein